MTPNLPPHLQEKMNEAAYSYDGPIHRNCYGCCQSDSDYAKAYKAGYQQAYSDILQELGPVVELVNGGYEQMQYMNPNVKESTYNKGVLDVCRRISKHLKERVMP